MTSINDIAKKAGVAKSTVSKVLNNYAVSENTRNRVEEAIRELGYVPNAAAISLAKKDFQRVGLIIDMNHYKQAIDEIDIRYLFGAFDQAAAYRIDAVTFFTSQFQHMSAEEIIRYLKSQGITGFIVYSLSHDNESLYDVIMSQEFRVVVVDSPLVNEKISSIAVDHYQGQYEVAKRTIQDVKHDKVLYIACGPDGYVTNARMSAMRRLQQQEKFELLIEYADYSERKAREITFARGGEADVIVCASDLMAVGAAYALQEMGMSKPVSGYDGITLMGYTRIPMYTLRQDFRQISAAAFAELVRLAEGETGRHIVAESEVVSIAYEDVIH